MDTLEAFFIPVVVFLVVVAPIWLVLHYRSKNHVAAGLAADEQMELEALSQRARQMADRIDALEAILDARVSGWRERAP